MQTPVDQLAAKQVHEDPRGTEEHDGAQNQSVVKHGVDQAVIIEVFPLVARRSNERQDHQRKERQKREQVNQYRTPAEKVLLDLQTKDRADLPEPKSPVKRRLL